MSALPVDLPALKIATGRTIETLVTMTNGNDPFAMHQGGRQEHARWLYEQVWQRLGLGEKEIHIRAIHYKLISQEVAVTLPNGEVFENTENHWRKLDIASRDARYLRLVPYDKIKDQRSEEPVCHLHEEAEGGVGVEDHSPVQIDRVQHQDMTIGTINTWIKNYQSFQYPDLPFPDPELPQLDLYERPDRSSTMHVEIWVEKATMADILDPIARRHHANLVTGVGEQSVTRCFQLIGRAQKSGKPVSILYISDFDPGGLNFPCSVARKLQFMLMQMGLDLGIQLRNIVLTEEQCKQYRLPRTPLKDTERRKDKFEEHYGEGATELDALEALHPGVLANLVTKEVERYRDPDFEDQVGEAIENFEADIDAYNHEKHASCQEDIDALGAEHREDVEALHANLRPLEERFDRAADEFDEAVEPLAIAYKEHADKFNSEIDAIERKRKRLMISFNKRAEAREQRLNEIRQQIADDIRDDPNKPTPDQIEWPHLCVDEDDEPLYDSGRGFLEQTDLFRKHLHKHTESKSTLKRLAKRRRNKIIGLKLLGVIDKKQAQRLIDNPDLPVPDDPDDDE